MTTWSIDDADGTALTQGISDEYEARAIAQRTADRLGQSVYLYEVGTDDEGDSEEIAPADADEQAAEYDRRIHSRDMASQEDGSRTKWSPRGAS